ncbi:ABC transporter ATP-binding protein [Methylomonas paludis]|uniref:ABC transporter ATP-binding protein n=1 Tax=Methylomonas paludis TaxID=1173101 RepID=A0A975MR74_9GAMM|nr:ABC transporter ATP-binding protein [Methylomonas paludis]QWF72315.1 ABC transporter ATP-binding protein [Methylomonas paludis]
MLEVKGLTRQYGNFVAVDNVEFTIGDREIVGLLGHNGAGKTTIMKMLSAYLEPDQGQILIGGHDLADSAKQVQQTLGYLPESLPIYPELVVADYLDYAAELKGLAGEQKFAEIRRVIQATAIQDRILAPIATLSRGYKQRVGVAQAILGKPKLLILDEPTNGLDPAQTAQMRKLIRTLAGEATVILSTHILQEVEALCDRVLILHGGRLVLNEKLDKLRHSNHLLLVTSLTPDAAERQLLGINGVTHLESLNQQPDQHSGYRYRLTLSDRDSSHLVSARLANTLVNAGADIYQIQPELRDLETLFREVSAAPQLTNINKEELSHAA